MPGDHVLADVGGDVQRQIPGHRHQCAEDPQHRRLQPVAGRGLRVVALLGDAAAAQRAVAVDVDVAGPLVRNDHHMVRLAVMQHDVVLVRRDPGAERGDREILSERVLLGGGPARLRRHRPAEHVEAAGDDAVVAGRRDDVGALRRKGNVALGDVIRSGHTQSSLTLAGCRSGRRSGRTCRRRRCRRRRSPAAPAADSDRLGPRSGCRAGSGRRC